jgi:hypothetical protein
VFNITYPDNPDAYGILEADYVSAGLFPCRVIPWPGKDVQFEMDRDTRRSLMRMMFSEVAAGVVLATSRIQLVTTSQMGRIKNSNDVGPIDPDTIFDIQGDPQVFYRRTAISHIEVILRALEG